MFLTCHDNKGIVVFEVDKINQALTTKEGTVQSLPGHNTKLFEDGEPPIIIRPLDSCKHSTPAEIRKYHELKEAWENSKGVFIWDARGLMLGNYVKRSKDNYWSDAFKGTFCKITLDEFIMIDTQAPRRIFEYVTLNDEWLDQLGFAVDRTSVTITVGDRTLTLAKFNKYAGVTDQNSAEMEAAITNGTLRDRYSFMGTPVDYVHSLQNIVYDLFKLDLIRKDGKR